MIAWSEFIYFASATVLLLFAGAIVAWKGRRGAALVLTIAGLCVYTAFIIGLWVSLQRPPMRTLGETRLWYSFFMAVSGVAVYARWKYRWIMFFSAVLATVFICLNIFIPQIHDQTLPPALQSGWFVPHVTVYIFSYSVVGCAVIMALACMIRKTDVYLGSMDSLIYIGTAFLTLGMLSGALWAKAAWGMYWSWDPKETWAAVTWCICLAYIHLRLDRKASWKIACILVLLAFLGLQMCWYGVNLLPAAQESMHVYGQ